MGKCAARGGGRGRGAAELYEIKGMDAVCNIDNVAKLSVVSS